MTTDGSATAIRVAHAAAASAACRSTGSPSGSARRRSSPTTARCSPSGSRCCAPTLPADIELSYAIKANPMPAVVQHLSGLVDGFDVASAGEMQVALDTPMPADRVSFAGPGKTPAELTPGGRRRRHDRARVRDRGGAGRRRPASGSASGRGSRCASTPTSRSRARGCGWAAARSSSASTPSGCPRCSPTSPRADLELLGFHVFAGSQNLNAEILCEAQRSDRRARPAARRGQPGARPLPQPRRRLRHPVLRAGPAARPRRGRREPRRPDGGRDPAQPARTPAWSSSSAATSSASAAST